MNPRIQLLLTLLEQAYGQRTWHGANLKYSLRGLGAEQALWRPAQDRHNIWEYTLHCAYWKWVVTGRIVGREAPFARPFTDFPVLGKTSASAWKNDLAFLGQCQANLLEAVKSLDPQRLDEYTQRWSLQEYIFGAANHDVYHAGQIQLLRRLQGDV